MSAIPFSHQLTPALRTQHARLIERVNRLYHEWTAGRFDDDHQARHRIEAKFWEWVGRTVLTNSSKPAGRNLVLDIACGSGFVLRTLAPFLSSHDVCIGVDLSAASLDRARAKALVPLSVRDFRSAGPLCPATSATEGRRYATGLPTTALGNCFATEVWHRSGSRRGDRLAGECGTGVSPVRAVNHPPNNVAKKPFWVGSSGTQLPVASRSVNLVTINASLHHFADPAGMLIEADRVLMPGGHLAIGFEPNFRYFQASYLSGIGDALDRLRWYMSPKENRRRILQIWNSSRPTRTSTDNDCGDEAIAEQIARRLVEDGLCREQLPPAAILDLIDVHARGEAHHRGLDLDRLFSTSLPRFKIQRVFTSDYLGASPRLKPALRSVADGIGRLVSPQSGSLISCLLRKPEETP